VRGPGSSPSNKPTARNPSFRSAVPGITLFFEAHSGAAWTPPARVRLIVALAALAVGAVLLLSSAWWLYSLFQRQRDHDMA
jgi:hypothetical protein